MTVMQYHTYETHNRCMNPRCDKFMQWYDKNEIKCSMCHYTLRCKSRSNSNSRRRYRQEVWRY